MNTSKGMNNFQSTILNRTAVSGISDDFSGWQQYDAAAFGANYIKPIVGQRNAIQTFLHQYRTQITYDKLLKFTKIKAYTPIRGKCLTQADCVFATDMTVFLQIWNAKDGTVLCIGICTAVAFVQMM